MEVEAQVVAAVANGAGEAGEVRLATARCVQTDDVSCSCSPGNLLLLLFTGQGHAFGISGTCFHVVAHLFMACLSSRR